MRREVKKHDFKTFDQTIEVTRKAGGISRNQLADKMYTAPQYTASIKGNGQHPSLQTLYEPVTLLDISADQFFFLNKETDKSTQRKQFESLFDDMSDKGLRIVTIMAKEIKEVETEDE